jgi:hypothetical protein
VASGELTREKLCAVLADAKIGYDKAPARTIGPWEDSLRLIRGAIKQMQGDFGAWAVEVIRLSLPLSVVTLNELGSTKGLGSSLRSLYRDGWTTTEAAEVIRQAITRRETAEKAVA